MTDYIHAAFAGLGVQTHEADEAERDIVQQGRQRGWKVAVWDVAGGLRLPGNGGGSHPEGAGGAPLAPLRALPALAERDGTALLLLHNFHRFLNNPEVVQTTYAQFVAGKQQRTFVVVLSPVVQIPVDSCYMSHRRGKVRFNTNFARNLDLAQVARTFVLKNGSFSVDSCYARRGKIHHVDKHGPTAHPDGRVRHTPSMSATIGGHIFVASPCRSRSCALAPSMSAAPPHPYIPRRDCSEIRFIPELDSPQRTRVRSSPSITIRAASRSGQLRKGVRLSGYLGRRQLSRGNETAEPRVGQLPRSHPAGESGKPANCPLFSHNT